jgi:hypothetical protein
VREPPSIVHEHAVDPFVARVVLDRLRSRSRDALVGGSVAAFAGTALVVAGEGRVGFAAIAGALAGVVVGAYARADRTALITRLVHQRSAYEIDEVAAAAEALVTPQACSRLAAAIGRLVLEADGLEPPSPAFAPCYSRIREYRSEFIAVAFHLCSPASRVHPSAAALITRLLTQASMSPLYNERLPAQQVRTALHRILGAVTVAS